MFLAGNGFYQTIGENKVASKLFLEIIKEAYKAVSHVMIFLFISEYF